MTIMNTSETIKKEMKKILRRRAHKAFPVLPINYIDTTMGWTDLAKNTHVCSMVSIKLENGETETMIDYGHEIVLFDAEGNRSAWNVENGAICWG